MRDLFLSRIREHPAQTPWGEALESMHGAGIPAPQILHLFNYKPAATTHLARFTEEVMRGPSELAPGERELIAAITSRVNSCAF